MKRLVVATLAVALAAPVATATDLNMSIKATANDTNAVTVAPGEAVPFYIEGTLSDDLNEGLALVGFNLHFEGGDLTTNTIDTPSGTIDCGNPMPNFVKDEGITNPDGFRGTLIAGDLIQVGGAQNTIKNTIANADFPLGTVLTGVAQPVTGAHPTACGVPAIIATGSLTAPAGAGTYELQLSELFANVITEGEIGDVFWATESIGLGGTIANLMITVGDVLRSLSGASPPCNSILTRAQGNVVRFTFDGAVPSLPVAGEIQIFELGAGGSFVGADLSSNFAFSLESGDTVLRIEETATAYNRAAWHGIVNNSWGGVGDFKVTYVVMPGNVNDDNFTDFGDLSAIFANQPGSGSDQDPYDVNADGFVDFGDLSAANVFNGDVKPTKPAGHDCAP